jgi:hypothetical protein
MGLKDSTTESTTNASTTPWAKANPTVDNLFSLVNGQMGNTGITPEEQQAITNLTNRGTAGNQFAGQAGQVATDLMNGGGATSENGNLTANLGQYKNLMGMYTDPNYSTVGSAPVKAALDAITTDTTNAQNAAAAGAGRSGSGLSAQALAQSIARAEAPVVLNQANLDTTNRQNAINGVYNAGNTTSGAITNNNTTANANKVQGVTQAGQATNFQNQGDQQVLQAQELLKTIPQSAISTLEGLGIPLAQLGTNSTSKTNTDSQMSGIDAMSKIAGMFSGGASSGISGLTKFGGGVASGAGSLLSLLGL